MKRHFSILVCALVAVAMMLTFASCDLIAPKHEHTFSGTWSSDATNHWHAATCNEEGCAAAKASVTAHSDADENKICDVCAYDMGHEHTYSESWAMDAENHWYAASCGHNAVADKAAHDLDDNGLCSVCGYIDGDLDVAKAIQFGVSFKDLVNKVVANYTYASYAGGNFDSYSVEYELGNGVAYIKDGMSEVDYWYSLNGEELFAVEEMWGEASLMDEPNENSLKGYNFSNVFNAYGEEEFYGVEELVSGLYALAAENFAGATQEYIVVVDGVTYYVFSFATIQYQQKYDYTIWEYVDTDVIESLYETQVMFTLTDNYSFGDVIVNTTKYNVIEEYYNEETEEYEYPSTGIVEFVYDEVDTTKIVGYEIVMFTADGSFVYDIAQTEGERTLEAKYDPDKSLVSSFALEYEDATPVSGTVNMTVGTPLYLYLGSIAPTTANLSIDNVEVACDGGYCYYSSWSGAVVLNVSSAGTFEATVYTSKASVTFNIVAEAPATTSLGFEIDEIEKTDYALYLESGSYASFDFAVIANEYADASCTVAIKDAPAGATLVKNDDGTYTFTATALGTYEIVATSTIADGVSATLTVTVEEAPEISDVLNGWYSVSISGGWSMTQVIVEFVPESEGAVNGTMNVEAVESSMYGDYEYSAKYTYEYVDGALTTTYVEGDELYYVFAIGNSFAPTVALNTYDMPYDMTTYTPPTTEESVAGEYRYTKYDESYETVYILKLLLNEDGTGSFVYMADYNPETWAYETKETDTFKFTAVKNEDGTYSITVSDVSEGGKIAAGTYVVGSVINNWDESVPAVLAVSVTIDGESANNDFTYNGPIEE